MATTLPPRKPVVRTRGSALVKAHNDRSNTRSVAVYIPEAWHVAMLEALAHKHGAIQGQLLSACSSSYCRRS